VKIKMVGKIGVIILAASIGLIFLWLKNAPHISVRPEKALLDQPIEIVISNLSAHQQITLEASCKDKDGNPWKSQATLQADDKGIVNVAKQAPITGSYKGIDPMGLFWSMAPTSKDPSKNTFMSFCTLNIGEAQLSVLSHDTCIAHQTIHRLYISPDVVRKDVREHGIVGTLFYPKDAQKLPGIIVIPGSGGNIPEHISQVLASHGYTVLALAYFRAEGLPQTFSLIPLEYFHNAITWLKKQSQVDDNKIALMGHSRGGEAALLVASLFPEGIDAVIAYGTSHLVYDDYSPEKTSPWIYKNKPLPYMPYLSNEEIVEAAKKGGIILHKRTIEDPYENTPVFLYTMKKFNKIINKVAIPVEHIRCPLLIISGDDDKLLPSSIAGNNIMQRLDLHGSKIKQKHVHYPNAGHNLFTFPYVPSIDVPIHIGSVWTHFGGTVEGNAQATKEAWQEMLNFLEETIGKTPKESHE
jgi:dienelactone hydrolase